MSTDLAVLLALGLLAFVLQMLPGTSRMAKAGIGYGIGNRDDPPPLAPWAARTQRAHANLFIAEECRNAGASPTPAFLHSSATTPVLAHRARGAPVLAITSRSSTPGASSTSRNPPSGATSITASSVMIRSTQPFAVSG